MAPHDVLDEALKLPPTERGRLRMRRAAWLCCSLVLIACGHRRSAKLEVTPWLTHESTVTVHQAKFSFGEPGGGSRSKHEELSWNCGLFPCRLESAYGLSVTPLGADAVLVTGDVKSFREFWFVQRGEKPIALSSRVPAGAAPPTGLDSACVSASGAIFVWYVPEGRAGDMRDFEVVELQSNGRFVRRHTVKLAGFARVTGTSGGKLIIAIDQPGRKYELFALTDGAMSPVASGQWARNHERELAEHLASLGLEPCRESLRKPEPADER